MIIKIVLLLMAMTKEKCIDFRYYFKFEEFFKQHNDLMNIKFIRSAHICTGCIIGRLIVVETITFIINVTGYFSSWEKLLAIFIGKIDYRLSCSTNFFFLESVIRIFIDAEKLKVQKQNENEVIIIWDHLNAR